MVTLYACEGSGNCMKPWLAMIQLDQEFEVKLIDVLNGEQKRPDFLELNPLGVVPFLEYSKDIRLGESNAMLWFLAEGTHLMPDAAAERAEALQWMFFEQSKLEPFISPARFYSFILPEQREAHIDEISQWLDRARPGLERLDAHLGSRRFMLQSGYSVTDIAIFGYVHVLNEAGIDPADYPMIERWIEDVTLTDKFQPLQNLGMSNAKAA
ncbi:glutathione S-transferase family protein [Octadecabacter sp. 1_MG-2023]|nr:MULTISPECIES: glutathione S-transferase family protein [unclassified Octadecabacter]MDO6735318.1 glutathione S-transferase family protein [Octadecabacter sp. 1_MG-2023]